MGSDLIGFAIAFTALYIAEKPATESMSYGFHRA